MKSLKKSKGSATLKKSKKFKRNMCSPKIVIINLLVSLNHL